MKTLKKSSLGVDFWYVSKWMDGLIPCKIPVRFATMVTRIVCLGRTVLFTDFKGDIESIRFCFSYT